MTYDTATAPAVEGRRRAIAGGTVEAAARQAAGLVEPTRPPSPIEDAFAFTADRLDRLEHVLGSLEQTAHRLGVRLEPVLTGGNYGRPDAPGDTELATPTPEDRRSTIARRISGHALRADRLADHATVIERLIEDLTDAIEV